MSDAKDVRGVKDARSLVRSGPIRRSQGSVFARQALAIGAANAKLLERERRDDDDDRRRAISEAESAADSTRRQEALDKIAGVLAEAQGRAKEAEANRPEPRYVKRTRVVNVGVRTPFGWRAVPQRQDYFEMETEDG